MGGISLKVSLVSCSNLLFLLLITRSQTRSIMATAAVECDLVVYLFFWKKLFSIEGAFLFPSIADFYISFAKTCSSYFKP